MPAKKKTRAERESAYSSSFNIPSTNPLTVSTSGTGGVNLAVSPHKTRNLDAVTVINTLRNYLRSRLHGPWTQDMLTQAEQLLNQLTDLV